MMPLCDASRGSQSMVHNVHHINVSNKRDRNCIIILLLPLTVSFFDLSFIFRLKEDDKTIGANVVKNLKLLPNDAAQFTRGMGMSMVWSSNRGFSECLWWCYS